MSKAWAVAKINFGTLAWGSFAAFNVMLALAIGTTLNFVQVDVTLNGARAATDLSPANGFWVLPFIAGITLPAYSFRRLANLGGKRDAFFWGGLVTHAFVALAVSFAVTLSNFTIEPFLETRGYGYYNPAFFGGIANIIEVFGWAGQGPFVAFVQQAAFLFFLCAFVHTLTALHHRWWGFAADAAIITVLSASMTIVPLREAIESFFRLVIFHQYAAVQILACLVAGAAVYALSKPVLSRVTL